MDKTKDTEKKLDYPELKEPFSYRKLFISTFLISAFTVGGGFVLIPLMKAKFVDEYGWLKENEALDLVSIAQSAPGVMAANSSIIMGYRMGGFLGSVTALLATILPPLITLTIISFFYDAFASNPYVRMFLKGMQCGVTAILIKVVFDLVVKQVKKKLALPLLVMAGTFIASVVFKINIMQIIRGRTCLCRRRLCVHAVDPGRGDRPAWLAYHDGIRGYLHPLADDARTHRH